MSFEIGWSIARDTEGQRRRYAVAAEPALGSDRLDQAIGAPWQAGGNARDDERYALD